MPERIPPGHYRTQDGRVLRLPPPRGNTKTNPCLAYGPGPDGKRCRDCARLIVKQYDKRYYKCELRRLPDGTLGGPATDHRVTWPACAHYVRADEQP